MKKSSLLIFALSALAVKAQITSSSFSTNASFVTGHVPLGMDHADFDGDGKQDIVVVNYYDDDNERGTTVSVYKNQRTPGVLNGDTYAPKIDYTVEGGLQEVAAHDMDGDGRADLDVPNFMNPGSISILRNIVNPNALNEASFAPRVNFPTTFYPNAVCIGDVDGDGKSDVVCTTNNTVTILRNTSTIGVMNFNTAANFESGINTQNPGPTNVQLGDLDGDGKLDIVVVNLHDNTFSAYRNISSPGAIAFEARVNYKTAGGPDDVAISDLDGDGKSDIVVVHRNSTLLYLYKNVITSGSFTSTSFASPVALN
ncbi:MAG: VCBS repeat-containing protein, partial [Bacteroidota bacterium]